MASMNELQDVVIIGGGPAGSTTATYLARQGHRVTLIEKEKFPREHVGESLLPFCYEILEDIGVLPELERRFVRKPGVRFIDTDGRQKTTWCFGHVLKGPNALSFHVVRAEYDHLLLKNSAKNGATVLEQTRVKEVDVERADSTVHVKAVGADGAPIEVAARFLVDASGRDTFMLNRMKWKVPHPELDRAAISTHWLGANFSQGLDEGLLQIVYLGGDKKGWIWVIPISPTRASIGVVLNHSYIRAQKAKLLEAGVTDWQAALYQQELDSSAFVRGVIDGAHVAQPMMWNGNYSYFAEKKYGNRFAIVGDASTFIDPILASGVYLSMNSAKLLAGALHEWLAHPEAPTEPVLAPVYEKINGAYGLVNKAIRFFYNPDSINFAQAGSASNLIHSKHEHAMAAGHYLLAGDFFHNHKRYSEFVDVLQDPKMFSRYRDIVIERHRYDTTTCGNTWNEVFGQIEREHLAKMEMAKDGIVEAA